MLNGLKPYNYLSYVLEKMKDLGSSQKRGHPGTFPLVVQPSG
ncbi:MAG: transposase domain-containing protein [Clostridiales bacterium]|nr:transposase domain-containing protein [Clostridiales bacterium]